MNTQPAPPASQSGAAAAALHNARQAVKAPAIGMIVAAGIIAGAAAAATQPVMPRILKTTPAAFANDVDPSLDKITVTFDRPMMADRWSFSEKTGSMFPELAGEISFDATCTTCTMPVRLQPGRDEVTTLLIKRGFFAS